MTIFHLITFLLGFLVGIPVGILLNRDPRDSNGRFCKKKWYQKL